MFTWLGYATSLRAVLVLGCIWGIMGIGVYITYKILKIADLTVDGSFVSGAAVTFIVLKATGNPMLALFTGFLMGMGAGLVTGLLHTLLGIPAILSGILTQIALWSINLKLMGPNAAFNRAMKNASLITSSNIWDAAWKVAIILVVIIAVLYIFFGTELGASIRATGNNEKMARSQGINTKFATVLGLMISNGLVAFAGGLLTQYNGNFDIKMGIGSIVTGLCAIIIGGAIFSKIGKNFAVRLFGVAVGAMVYFFVYQTVIFLRFDTDLLKLISAVAVALVLGIPYIRKHYGTAISKRIKNRKLRKRDDTYA